MISEKEVKKLVKEGWIKSYMLFEVVSTSKELAEKALKEHIEKLEKDERAKIVKKEFHEPQELGTEIKTLFSAICEVELLAQNLSSLAELVAVYGPSACEVIEPDVIKVSVGEAQELLNLLGRIMHKLSELAGGIVVKREN